MEVEDDNTSHAPVNRDLVRLNDLGELVSQGRKGWMSGAVYYKSLTINGKP